MFSVCNRLMRHAMLMLCSTMSVRCLASCQDHPLPTIKVQKVNMRQLCILKCSQIPYNGQPSLYVDLLCMRTFPVCGLSLYVDLPCMWTFPVCGPSLYVDLLCMWTFSVCGPSLYGDLPCMWTYPVCGPTLYADLPVMRTFSVCGPTLYVDLPCMRTFSVCGPSIPVCGPSLYVSQGVIQFKYHSKKYYNMRQDFVRPHSINY